MRRARCAAGRRPATSLVAGVDVKTAQTVLGHTDARVTLDLYAQVVTEQQQAAADAMAARFLDPTPREKRGMDAQAEGRSQAAETTERACAMDARYETPRRIARRDPDRWSGFHFMVAGWTLLPTPAPRRPPR